MMPRRPQRPRDSENARGKNPPASNIEAGGGISASWGAEGLTIRDTKPQSLWVVITGQAAGTNRYSWEAVDEGDTTDFAIGLAEGFAASGTSDEGVGCAYEINGRDDVPTDSSVRVRLWPAGDFSYYTFDYASSTSSANGHVRLKTGSYTLTDDDRGCLISFSATTPTLTLPAPSAPNFADGWACDVEARGTTTTLTISAASIDGGTSLTVRPNQGVRLWSNGSAWYTQRGMGDVSGPEGVTAGAHAYFDGATGKLLKQSATVETQDTTPASGDPRDTQYTVANPGDDPTTSPTRQYTVENDYDNAGTPRFQQFQLTNGTGDTAGQTTTLTPTQYTVMNDLDSAIGYQTVKKSGSDLQYTIGNSTGTEGYGIKPTLSGAHVTEVYRSYTLWDGATALVASVDTTASGGATTMQYTVDNLDFTGVGAIDLTGVTVTGLTTGVRTEGTLAAAGSTQGDAAAIVTDAVDVTGADGTKGVILPNTAAAMIVVRNTGVSALKVYPNSGAQIASLGTNAADSIIGLTRMYVRVTSTQWVYKTLDNA